MPLYSIPDRQAFHNWLAQRLDRNVGRPARTASCPLATWLRQVNKNRRLHVCYAGLKMALADPDEPTGQFDEMPQWCADFVEAFDTLVECRPTTGDIALAILNDLD